MKHKITALLLLALCLATIVITTQIERIKRVSANEFSVDRGNQTLIQATCALRPEINTTTPFSLTPIDLSQITLERFRRTQSSVNSLKRGPINPSSFSTALASYTPRESIALANSTNYGDRFVFDLYGQPASHSPIVVIHETASSARSAINTFRTPHVLESKQVSYHTLIKLDGEIVYLVPPDKRAFGAGNSVFQGENGKETVKTNPDYPPSVNNFAYHVSLETPPDGYNDRGTYYPMTHSGYTSAQYQSLAWLVAKTGVPSSRITTHKAVDRSGQRGDPKSFNKATFLRLLEAQPKTNEIVIGCQPPTAGSTR